MLLKLLSQFSSPVGSAHSSPVGVCWRRIWRQEVFLWTRFIIFHSLHLLSICPPIKVGSCLLPFAAPTYDRSSWLDVKPNLGLDFPNVSFYIKMLAPVQLLWTSVWYLCFPAAIFHWWGHQDHSEQCYSQIPWSQTWALWVRLHHFFIFMTLSMFEIFVFIQFVGGKDEKTRVMVDIMTDQIMDMRNAAVRLFYSQNFVSLSPLLNC